MRTKSISGYYLMQRVGRFITVDAKTGVLGDTSNPWGATIFTSQAEARNVQEQWNKIMKAYFTDSLYCNIRSCAIHLDNIIIGRSS